MLNKNGGYKYFDLPLANYGYYNFDSVQDQSGKHVGFSMWTGYSENERTALSLATLDPHIADRQRSEGDLGVNPDGGSRKATVETARASSLFALSWSPAPYSAVARNEYYQQGWRTAAS